MFATIAQGGASGPRTPLTVTGALNNLANTRLPAAAFAAAVARKLNNDDESLAAFCVSLKFFNFLKSATAPGRTVHRMLAIWNSLLPKTKLLQIAAIASRVNQSTHPHTVSACRPEPLGELSCSLPEVRKVSPLHSKNGNAEKLLSHLYVARLIIFGPILSCPALQHRRLSGS